MAAEDGVSVILSRLWGVIRDRCLATNPHSVIEPPANSPFSSLQRFKLDVASTVVNQQNAGLATMETDQILDLFNVGETVAVTKQSEEEMVDVTTGEVKQKGAKGVLDDIGELWDESQYTDEYDLGNFIASLRE